MRNSRNEIKGKENMREKRKTFKERERERLTSLENEPEEGKG